ncbi:MAG: hypothetical protein MK105_12490 [Crocinitomicaceae bacterium]|nr:hypothetical protein [Crocinitomicaceae bacterium]
MFDLTILYLFEGDDSYELLHKELSTISHDIRVVRTPLDYSGNLNSLPIQTIENCDCLISRVFDNYDYFIKHAKNLKYIGTGHTDTSDYELEMLNRRKITLNNVQDYCTNSVAELTFFMLLNFARKFPLLNSSPTDPSIPFNNMGNELKNKKVGIIGAGNIGERMAIMCSHFMEVDYWSRKHNEKLDAQPRVSYTALDEMYASCDFISLHLKLTKNTKGFIGEREINLMKTGSVVLNPSKPELIDLHYLKNTSTAPSISIWFDELHSIEDRIIFSSFPYVHLTNGYGWLTKEAQSNSNHQLLKSVKQYAKSRLLIE